MTADQKRRDAQKRSKGQLVLTRQRPAQTVQASQVSPARSFGQCSLPSRCIQGQDNHSPHKTPQKGSQQNRQKRPAEKAAAFSGGVLRVAWVRVNQFSLYVDPGPSLGTFSSKISPIRGHYA